MEEVRKVPGGLCEDLRTHADTETCRPYAEK